MTFTRRSVLRVAGLAGTAALLAACGDTSGTTPVRQPRDVTPRRGGMLRVAFAGGGPSESLDPFAGAAPIDLVRNDVIYDSLFVMRDGLAQPSLATGLKAESEAFVVKLREGVTWHDGSAFTADDVVYGLGYMGSPDRPHPSELMAYFDLTKTEAIDARTVRVPMLRPIGDPALLLAAFPAKMVKKGADGVGTGPFEVDAFEPGRLARLKRFAGYWGEPEGADELVMLSVSDASAQVNAVTTGQADYTGDIPFTAAKTGARDDELEIRTAGKTNRAGYAFVLNATQAPFDDERVRRAVRLAVDRQALVDTVFLGFGAAGNDLFGAGQRFHDDRAPLRRDVEEAKRLVRAAGADGAQVLLRSAEYQTGYNPATKLFAEQLKAIGLDARPQLVGLAEFFEPAALARAHSVTFSIGTYPLAVAYGRLAGIETLVLPGKDFSSALSKALAAPTAGGQAKAWQQLQDLMFERGNTVVWGQAEALSLARKNVAGIEVREHAQYPYFGKAGLA